MTSTLIAPLIERLPTPRIYGGRSYDQFRTTGPKLPHRGHPAGVQLLIPCDLSALDECLQRLPQDKPRMGFRLNVNSEPWMLRPNGNWGTAKVSRTDGRRMGWERGPLFVHSQGICTGGPAGIFYRKSESPDLPMDFRVAQVIAKFCLKLNDDPSNIRDYGLDSTTNCMCCGKALTVEKSQVRGVGPECIQVLEQFLGLSTDKTIAEMEARND